MGSGKAAALLSTLGWVGMTIPRAGGRSSGEWSTWPEASVKMQRSNTEGGDR